MGAWHDDDALWAELQGALTDAGLIRAAEEEARQAATMLQVRPDAHLLDLGCGPGRHSLAFARLGYRVTGVDRTAGYLEAARSRSAAEGLAIEWVRADMLAFRRESAFDGAANLLSSFGYFEDRHDDLRVLRNIQFSLKPGARAMVDVVGKEILARVFVPRYWQELGKGRFWLQEREVLPAWERIRNHWLFVGAGETRAFTFEHRIYSANELAELMREAGFGEVEVHGGFDGRAYDREAARLIAVGRKPEM